MNDIATVSDEAFVLLVLENIWDDMMKVSIGDYYQPKKWEKRNDNENNDSTSATTNRDTNQVCNPVITGQWTSAWRGCRRYGGWSPEGLNCFNQLVKMVTQDRVSDTHFQA